MLWRVLCPILIKLIPAMFWQLQFEPSMTWDLVNQHLQIYHYHKVHAIFWVCVYPYINWIVQCFCCLVPNDTVSVATEVFFQPDGSPIISLEIKVCYIGHNTAFVSILNIFLQFPTLCPFERLNYSILLIEMSEGRHTVVSELQRSAMSPTEPVSEMMDSDLKVNANYSVTVYAATNVWNTSTHYYNISESRFCSSVTVYRHKENLLCIGLWLKSCIVQELCIYKIW